MENKYLPESYKWEEGIGLFEIKENSKNKLEKTIPAPVGKLKTKENKNPTTKLITEKKAE